MRPCCKKKTLYLRTYLIIFLAAVVRKLQGLQILIGLSLRTGCAGFFFKWGTPRPPKGWRAGMGGFSRFFIREAPLTRGF